MSKTAPTPVVVADAAKPRLIPQGVLLPFFLVTALFFLWGTPSNLNDVLIRQFMKAFAISRFRAGLVQSAFYMGYFLLAMPAALLMRRYGYKFGFITGLLLFGTGSILFWPAAIVGRYGFFLAALFVIASGLSFLETASNPFIVQIGDQATAAQRLNLAQSFNPLGAITGALVGTVFIFSGIELSPAQTQAMQTAHTYAAYLHHETMRVIVPYVVLGSIALLWAVLIGMTRFPKIASEHEGRGEDHGHFTDLLRHPSFLLAVFAQFMYVGAQVGTWSYFIQYIQEATHKPEKFAGYLLTGTLVAFAVGRFVSSALMSYIRADRLMAAYAIVNVALVAIGVLSPGWVGLCSIFLTSFFMSVMFPTIFALGIEGLGPNTKIGGSLLVMAIVGGAVMTPLMGLVSQSGQIQGLHIPGIALAYLLPLVGYCVVALYSLLWPRLSKRGVPSSV
jgi:FHS family L-fucose permease-like MFS transporter